MVLVAFITFRSSEFAVTDRRVIIKVGWIKRRTLETMPGKVEAVRVDQGKRSAWKTRSARLSGSGLEAREERECPFRAERILVRSMVCRFRNREVAPAS